MKKRSMNVISTNFNDAKQKKYLLKKWNISIFFEQKIFQFLIQWMHIFNKNLLF